MTIEEIDDMIDSLHEVRRFLHALEEELQRFKGSKPSSTRIKPWYGWGHYKEEHEE